MLEHNFNKPLQLIIIYIKIMISLKIILLFEELLRYSLSKRKNIDINLTKISSKYYLYIHAWHITPKIHTSSRVAGKTCFSRKSNLCGSSERASRGWL